MIMLSGWSAMWQALESNLQYVAEWLSTHYVEYHEFRISYAECAFSFFFITLVTDVIFAFASFNSDGYEDDDE